MLNYIKQHISKLVIAGDYEATSEGQSSQPEKNNFRGKKNLFFSEYLDFSQLLI